jgi:membrane-bound serine protease (ClpP class)
MLITDPNLAYLVLLAGLWMSILAVYIPGTGFSEVLALGTLAAGLFLLSMLPTNWLAVLLLALGTFDFLLLPFFQRRLTPLAGIGIILQFVSSLILFSGMSVSWLFIAGGLLVSLAFYRYILIPARTARTEVSVLDDQAGLLGLTGRVIKPLAPVGTVLVRGEMWTAYSDDPIQIGDEIVVLEKEGFRVRVEKIKAKRRPQPDSVN